MIGPTDITVIFGQRGSGKSEIGKAIAKLYPRLFVIDILREWKKTDGIELITDSFDTAANFLHETIGRRRFRAVFQMDIDSSDEVQKQTLNALLRLLYKRGTLTGENVCLLIEEVHFFCGPNWAEEWLAKCTTVGRHANLAMIMSSQRPAQVYKAFISQAQNVLVGRLFEPRDIDYLKQSIGDVSAEIPNLEKYKFIFQRENEPFKIVDRELFK